ncbi:S1 family peptidase [Jidongwangia harbinensis]|uniref:S1 family peptidase n=1 Tax=Jidongwangia harbinensis TaxID=2878561 RepID=UPI001CD99093|nr:S1 family peptidase [Jidongwangia harbinensis]MCA2215245.1 S1 family peptidase [Jidongwangia harbinensis]
MQRKRIAIAAVAVVATGAAVAFTLPSMAGTTSPRGGSAPRAAAGDVAPQLLEAMRRDLGVDDAEARARVDRAEWAGRTSARLAAQTGSEFGGAWLADDGTTLKIAVTDRDAMARVRAAGAEPVLVKRSEQDLDVAKEKLDAARSAAGDLTGWYVDPATNKLVVVAQPGNTDDAWAFAEEAGLDTDAVAVKTQERPKPLVDVRGADAYLINGNAKCSVGFSVEGGFVTAGHCGRAGSPTSTEDGQQQGTVRASVFPGTADMGFVEVNGNFTPEPVVNDFAGNLLPVAGNTEAPVGAAICRSGSTTGTFCGEILAKNQTVVYPEGAVTGLTQTNVCAEPGDSGGPWLSGDQAQGVTSGGSGNCDDGGVTFFQPVNEILAVNDLTLVTTGGGGETAPPAEEGEQGDEGGEDETSACAGLPNQREGSLSRAGNAQAQPNGGAYRAGSGRQTACLDAPEGADFDLVLQRLTLGGFRTVAQANGTGDKELTFSGRSGTYRYVVVARSGTGAYTLGFSTP